MCPYVQFTESLITRNRPGFVHLPDKIQVMISQAYKAWHYDVSDFSRRL